MKTNTKIYITSFLASLLLITQANAGETLLGGDDARKQWSEKGFDFEAGYTADYGTNLSGGASTGSTYLDNTIIGLGIDGSKVGIKGASFYFNILGNQGQKPSPSTMVGDAQGVTNIEAANKWQLHEAWYEQKFGERFSTKLGRYDLNSEFDAIDTAGLFLNGSHGIGADISQTGPSLFPGLYPGLRLAYQMDKGRYLQSVYMSNDTVSPNDNILFVEYGKANEQGTSKINKYAIGLWYFNNTKTTDAASNPVSATNNQGVYGLIDAALSREQGQSGQGLNGYLRYGMANSVLNQFASYMGAGLVYTGLFEGRDEDQMGLAIAIASNGSTYKAANATATANETNIELSYRFQVKPWLAIQPDVQYVINPGADSANANATYFTVRMDVAL